MILPLEGQALVRGQTLQSMEVFNQIIPLKHLQEI